MSSVTARRSARSASAPRSAARPGRIGAPPIPHEHGAWVMLFLPMLAGFAVARPSGWAQVLLLSAAISGAYLARHPADLLLRGKGVRGSTFWMFAYGILAVGAAAPLVLSWHASALLVVAGIAGVLFGIHAILLGLQARRRWDRSIFGELLAVAGLTLGGPAAVVVSRGTFTPDAWTLWAGFSLFFAGGVLHVKTLLSGAKHKGQSDWAVRWRLGRASVLYHVLLPAASPVVAARFGISATLVLVAVAPATLRALWSVARLDRRLPPLKRVGAFESVCAIWFACWFSAALMK